MNRKGFLDFRLEAFRKHFKILRTNFIVKKNNYTYNLYVFSFVCYFLNGEIKYKQVSKCD